MSTIQLDFAAKERFGLTYKDETGAENGEVFVIHRAPLSTHERFVAFLTNTGLETSRHGSRQSKCRSSPSPRSIRSIC
ncbi:MAG: hypothetical protein CM1200mP21_07050 [Candidatus Poseidoniales archaeon]|nr:MAG: hypothetical protein CM1200mP21_07050 [Candidatus Poseidoniales archaeon]